MKKLKLSLAVILLMASATTLRAQVSFGVKAGVNFYNLNGEYDDDKLENKLKTGFEAGVNVNIPVAEDFYLQPGLSYITKGATIDDVLFADEAKVTLGYVELPINFIYKPALGAGRMLLGVGPYFGYGVNGKVHFTDSNIDDVDVEWDDAPNVPDDKFYMKPFDAGANVLVGYEFAKGLSFQLNAQVGLTNNDAYNANNDDKLKNTGFGLSIGYRFGK